MTINTCLKTGAVACLLTSLASSAFAQFQLQTAWSLAPGDRSYLTTGHTERGLGYNPATGNLLVVSRAGGLNVAVLNATNGSHVGFLDTTGISGGTFPLNMIGVGADGAIYGGNLTTDTATAPYRLYRWANESAVPELVFDGVPGGGRFGDTIAVRGSGSGTEVLIDTRGGNNVALLTPGATSWNAQNIVTGAPAGDLGLGNAFDGSTFWATASGRSLHQIGFDGSVIGTYGSAVVAAQIGPIAVDEGNRLLAGLRTDSAEVYLYNLANLSQTELNTPLDIGTLATANANTNGTGDMVFANGRLYVLGTNNGVTAFDVIPEPSTYALLLGVAALGVLGVRRFRARRG